MGHRPWEEGHNSSFAGQSEKVPILGQVCLFMCECGRLDMDYVDLYLMHSANGGKVLETWDAMVQLKEQGLTRFVDSTQPHTSYCQG